ncbi:MAG: hypothetical protein SRB1_00609 [Desulfobacteraceae bacterium Eth-SRB1]|nr:MAG: hypothetical protein SRB1_00609 [Desulfobacteraceae bacterium Eth-SRB1]
MVETNQKGPQENGRAILENLKSLRFHEGDETEFWEILLSDVSVLCKSPAVFFMTKRSNDWRVRQEFYSNEAMTSDKESFFAAALNLVERACQNGFAYERLDMALPRISLPVALVIKIDAGNTHDDEAALLLVADRENARQFNDVVVRAQLISDIPLHYYIRKQQSNVEGSDAANPLLVNALEVAGRIMDKEKFLLSCMTLVNEIASRFNCSQVSMGWKKGSYIRMVAISNLEDFKEHSEEVHTLEGLFEEAYEQNETVACPEIDNHFIVDRTHQNYLRKLSLHQVVTIPVFLNGTIVAVVTCEKQDSSLTATEIDTIKLILNQIVPWMNVLYFNDRWVGSRVVLRCRETLDSLLGVEHSLLKAMAIVISMVFLYSIIGVWDYKVEGSAVLKTDAVRYISAPYDGLISDVKVHEGDRVAKGNLLLKLDTQELVLKETQESAKKVSYAREVEKHRANETFADMQIAQSKFNEAQAGLDKVRYYIEQAGIKAPFDGIVVEGDKRKLLGSPVSKGDILLKIAKVDAMYASVKVSERDIDQITQGAKGHLILLSKPNDTFDITFDKLIPMAEVDQREGNVFVIKTIIDDEPQSWWRPGMSGIAKFNAGERKIIWILTHRFTEFIRMYFWW